MRLFLTQKEFETALECVAFTLSNSSRLNREQPPYVLGIKTIAELEKKLKSHDDRKPILVHSHEELKGLANSEDRKLA